MQQVVFNGHYVGWCDIACAAWFHEALGWTGMDDDVDWILTVNLMGVMYTTRRGCWHSATMGRAARRT